LHFNEIDLNCLAEGDSENYLTYYKRATVLIALGRPKHALEDLNEVIERKVDFMEARMQRGQLYLKLGRLDESHIDFEWVLRIDPHRTDAIQHYSAIESIRNELQNVEVLMDHHIWADAIAPLSRLILEMPYDVTMRELRATCYEKIGDKQSAITDIRATTRMKRDDTPGLLRLSKLQYSVADIEESLNSIRECLRFDPDHKDCKTHYRKVKELVSRIKAMNNFASANDFASCVEKADAAYKLESNILDIVQIVKARKCHCQNKAGAVNEAIATCTEALNIAGGDANVLCDRAEAYINNDDFDRAKNDFQQALQINAHLHRAEEGLRRVQKLIKQSKSRDYYKILDVKRNSDKREIVRAYRKLAAKWHPDNFHGDEKVKAEKMFIDIAAAKEVLTDAEKRAQFDNGQDPLDPEAQNQSPFRSHGRGQGHPFNDMPFEFVFKSHFNH
jgi:DnaJ family protein C protein 3